LHAAFYALGNVLHEVFSRCEITMPKPPRCDQLAIRVNTNPEPNVASIWIVACNLFRPILLFTKYPRSQLIKLQPLAAQVLKHLILIHGTYFPNPDQEAHGGFLRYSGHTDRGANRTALH
jgi:hypothetical protein